MLLFKYSSYLNVHIKLLKILLQLILKLLLQFVKQPLNLFLFVKLIFNSRGSWINYLHSLGAQRQLEPEGGVREEAEVCELARLIWGRRGLNQL